MPCGSLAARGSAPCMMTAAGGTPVAAVALARDGQIDTSRVDASEIRRAGRGENSGIDLRGSTEGRLDAGSRGAAAAAAPLRHRFASAAAQSAMYSGGAN